MLVLHWALKTNIQFIYVYYRDCVTGVPNCTPGSLVARRQIRLHALFVYSRQECESRRPGQTFSTTTCTNYLCTVYWEILATVLILQFGDLEAYRQIKNSPILAGQLDRLSARAGSKFTFDSKIQRTICSERGLRRSAYYFTDGAPN